MREHMLDVVRELPQLELAHDVDSGGGDYLVVVVDQLEERLLDIARTRALEHVAAPDLLLERKLLEDRDDTLAQLAGEQVVEILGRACAAARVPPLEGPPCGGDILPRINEAE